MLSDVSLLTPPPSKPPPMIPDRDQTPWAPIILGVKHIHQSSPQRHHHQIHGIGSVCMYLYLSIFVFVFLQWRKSCLISCGWDSIRQRLPNLVCIWGQKDLTRAPPSDLCGAFDWISIIYEGSPIHIWSLSRFGLHCIFLTNSFSRWLKESALEKSRESKT